MSETRAQAFFFRLVCLLLAAVVLQPVGIINTTMYSVVGLAGPFLYKWLFPTGNNNSKSQEQDEYVEGIVCNDSEVGENQMKQVDLEDAGKVLLIRKNGKLSALGAKCTHYGAPLHAGALGENRVRCQWHGACFNILTGDIEDFPGNTIIFSFCITIGHKHRDNALAVM